MIGRWNDALGQTDAVVRHEDQSQGALPMRGSLLMTRDVIGKTDDLFSGVVRRRRSLARIRVVRGTQACPSGPLGFARMA